MTRLGLHHQVTGQPCHTATHREGQRGRREQPPGTLSARGSLGIEQANTERTPTQPFSSSSKSRSSDTEGSFEGVNIQNLEMTLVLK